MLGVEEIIDRIWNLQGENVEEWKTFRNEIWPEIEKLPEADLEVLMESGMTEMLSMICSTGDDITTSQ